MPAALPIMYGLVIAGTATKVVGDIKAGNAAKSAGDYNAAVAELQAQDALDRGKQDEGRFRQSVKGLIGTQRAGFAGQGVDVGSGSARDVQADAAYLGELDALTIRNNAARESWGYKVDAENARRGGAAAQSASRFDAIGSIMGTGANLLAAKYGWGGSSSSLGRQTVPTASRMPGAY